MNEHEYLRYRLAVILWMRYSMPEGIAFAGAFPTQKDFEVAEEIIQAEFLAIPFVKLAAELAETPVAGEHPAYSRIRQEIGAQIREQILGKIL